MKIEFNNEKIEIQTKNNSHQIVEPQQAVFVEQLLKCCCYNSEDEQTFHAYVGILDLFKSAKRKLIEYKELIGMKCTKN